MTAILIFERLLTALNARAASENWTPAEYRCAFNAIHSEFWVRDEVGPRLAWFSGDEGSASHA